MDIAPMVDDEEQNEVRPLSHPSQPEEQHIEHPPSHTPEETWQDRIELLTTKIANDSQLKRGKEACFQNRAQETAKIWNARNEQGPLSDHEYLLFAGIYKNLGKLGGHQESLEKAIMLLQRANADPGLVVKWTLQLTAMKSSLKKHQECLKLAEKGVRSVRVLLKGAQEPFKDSQEQAFLVFLEEMCEQETQDEIIWKYIERNFEEELLVKVKKAGRYQFPVPFFSKQDFQIADIMTLEACVGSWAQERIPQWQLVAFLSIGYFTLATESYYLGDYSRKKDHLRAIKLALTAFDLNCTYLSFLFKILKSHFGEELQSIAEQKSVLNDSHELMQAVPPETQEVPLAFLEFPE